MNPEPLRIFRWRAAYVFTVVGAAYAALAIADPVGRLRLPHIAMLVLLGCILLSILTASVMLAFIDAGIVEKNTPDTNSMDKLQLTPETFPEANTIFKGAPGDDDVRDLPALRTDAFILTCWRVTPEQLEEIRDTGRIYVYQMTNDRPQPICLSAEYPFRNQDEWPQEVENA